MTVEDMMKKHREKNPRYEGTPCAPLGRYPERDGSTIKTFEDLDREREDRFRHWLGPNLYGWLSDLEDKG